MSDKDTLMCSNRGMMSPPLPKFIIDDIETTMQGQRGLIDWGVKSCFVTREENEYEFPRVCPPRIHLPDPPVLHVEVFYCREVLVGLPPLSKTTTVTGTVDVQFDMTSEFLDRVSNEERADIRTD